MSDVEEQVTQAWNHLREGHTDQALKQFQTTVTANPNDIDAIYGLGLAQQKLKHRDDAVESFNQALALISQAQKSLAGDENLQDHIRTPEEDRFLMLSRMVKQRLEELSVNS